MKLEVVLQTLVEGRTNQVPSDELASSVSMQPVELEIFEENIRREFLAKYNVYYNLDAVAENLGWPGTADYFFPSGFLRLARTQ